MLEIKKIVKAVYFLLRKHAPFKYVFKFIWDPLKTRISLFNYSKNKIRKIEIGSSGARIPGFETLSIVGGLNIDYVLDASKAMPFPTGTFDIIYASHVLEHIPWYQTLYSLKEWVRILKPGGNIEIWVPNGKLICETLLKTEQNENKDDIELDGWYKFNTDRNPYLWVNGRIFSYGNGDGALNSNNWHRSMFTPAFLQDLFERVGLIDVHQMDRSQVRGMDHGWINLGMKGRKP